MLANFFFLLFIKQNLYNLSSEVRLMYRYQFPCHLVYLSAFFLRLHEEWSTVSYWEDLFVPLMKFLPYSLDSRSFLSFWGNLSLIFLLSLFVSWCPFPAFKVLEIFIVITIINSSSCSHFVSIAEKRPFQFSSMVTWIVLTSTISYQQTQLLLGLFRLRMLFLGHNSIKMFRFLICSFLDVLLAYFCLSKDELVFSNVLLFMTTEVQAKEKRLINVSIFSWFNSSILSAVSLLSFLFIISIMRF